MQRLRYFRRRMPWIPGIQTATYNEAVQGKQLPGIAFPAVPKNKGYFVLQAFHAHRVYEFVV